MINKKIKIIAFHLPQFHPTAENNKWWGDGFTEWTNVAKARSLFPGHSQPIIPGELGFYDLRLKEVREQQAELATWAGIAGFCYYHYWFAGRLLLEKPIELLLKERSPSLPFCLCWANHSWTNHWAGLSDKVLVEQTYPGNEDHRRHYEYLRQFFQDERYLTINDKPLLAIFRPNDIPNIENFTALLKEWAVSDGYSGIYLIGLDGDTSLLDKGFDALAPHSLNVALSGYLKGFRRLIQQFRYKILRYPRWVINYSALNKFFKNNECDGITSIPTLIPNWDNTPRVGRRGLVLSGASPENFRLHVENSVRGVKASSGESEKVIFVKSWNEWAEGNYLEPDLAWGRKWLEVIKESNI